MLFRWEQFAWTIQVFSGNFQVPILVKSGVFSGNETIYLNYWRAVVGWISGKAGSLEALTAKTKRQNKRLQNMLTTVGSLFSSHFIKQLLRKTSSIVQFLSESHLSMYKVPTLYRAADGKAFTKVPKILSRLERKIIRDLLRKQTCFQTKTKRKN